MLRRLLLIAALLSIFGPAQAAITVVNGGTAVITGTSANPSVCAAVPFGTAAAGRLVVVPGFITGTGTTTSGSIGGIASTLSGSGGTTSISILASVVPTGTSGAVSTTRSTGTNSTVCGGSWILSGAANSTMFATLSNGSAASGTINVPANGAAVFSAICFGAAVWIGATAGWNNTVLGGPVYYASFTTVAAAPAHAVSAGASCFIIEGASFSPGGGPPPAAQKGRGYILN